MRFKINKRNVLFLSFTALIALSLGYIILKSNSSQRDNERTVLRKDIENANERGVIPVSTPNQVRRKFQYGTLFEMKKSVYESNLRQFIRNADKFPKDPELVIVVQVHNRPAYLRLLVESLSKAFAIHNVLLIFSHDYFSEEISDIVQGITFCKVLQIHFPFSMQLYPHEFPGQDPRDCPRDISKEDAKKKGCLNADCPDSYGHYREASFTQTKHHWWWKLHFVWERVRALQGFSGYVLFLEEDNYLLPDFYRFFKRMTELKQSDCPDCDMLVLGNHEAPQEFRDLTDKLETSGWSSTRHNMGMGISKEVYYKLMGCAHEYCTYDDYNWDWTLQHLSGSCIPKPLKVMAARASRVLHTGDCGLHQKESCNPEQALQKVQQALQSSGNFLFPHALVLDKESLVEHKPHMKNGGWGDLRDHTLCKNYAKIL
uniref:Si:ch73-91k6.2 n=1 Tax=Lepisosteus oculatus TaxID=7918 RepID=W5NN88_LEPOC|nr:PREDICTED: alpha-1,6-mannosyl-glycoprotein 2-beta-N-acetylglucosaminyltransferase-like [Lepisosteus oculatus]XP_015204788.1 PREDICTED: alpha-1,6-mannosyl-glycoprotein 2-beta-N-acetylglucosaminyltransferase-like [Lepisosteus oculatus]